MTVSQPTVSVIMPVRNAALTLEKSVRSILNQTYPYIEGIILAVGPSNDATENIARNLQSIDKRIALVDNDLGETAVALNKAADVASGEYLVRVDSHCQIPPEYIANAIETIVRTGAGNVGGIQKAVGDQPFQQAVALAMSSRFGVGNSKFHYGGEEGPTDTVYLGVYDANLFHSLGGFDESLVRNQDYELNIRIRRADRTIWFDPRLIVDYFPRSDLLGLSSQYFQYGKWKRRVILKNPRSIKIRQIIPPLMVLSLISSLVLSFSINCLFLIIPIFYLTTIFAACLSISGTTMRKRLILAFIFPTMHLFWGMGFLFGKTR